MKILTKQYWADSGDFIVAAVQGTERFCEASALVIVSISSIYYAQHYVNNVITNRVLLSAAGVIFLRGAVEFLRFVARKESNGNTRDRQKGSRN